MYRNAFSWPATFVKLCSLVAFAACWALINATVAQPAAAQQQAVDVFKPGTAIPAFGKIASVKDSDLKIPADVVLKVRFDVAKQSPPEQINQTLDSAARLINLHVASGVKQENLQIAIVLHGSATWDVTKLKFLKDRQSGRQHGNVEAVQTLVNHHVRFYVCGQSAAYHRITKSDLLPGVKLAPSAMTAHAVLAHEGYSLNPF